MTPRPAPAKPVYLSRTFWVNVVACGVALAAAFGVDVGLDGEQQVALAAALAAVVNVALRFVTVRPVTVRRE